MSFRDKSFQAATQRAAPLLPLVALPLVALSGCITMAPHYERPAAPVPNSWPQGAAYGSNSASDAAKPAKDATPVAADLPWQQFVLDQRLRQVIQIALENSRDLRKSVAAIESARAQYRVQRASQLPSIDAGVSGSRARSLDTTSGSANTTVLTQSYSATVGLSSFELDLFGKLHSESKAALESYLATAETARATRISLIAETASAWLTLAADRSQLAIAQETLQSAQRSMGVTQKRLDAGVASAVDVHEAETVYQQARADVASYLTTVAQDRNALELLAGHGIDDALLPEGLATDTQWLADVPAGLSSDVLLQRPDVLSAEHTLKSANFSIGAARASFFPTLSLTAADGLASTALSTLFSNGSNIWSVAPSVSLPLFSGGSNRATLAYARSQKQEYLASYELTVQTAFKEVADALARRGTIVEQLDAQQALVNAAASSYQLAEARYEKGADTFLNALDSQRTLYSAQQTLISTRLTALDNSVTLYRVLGGGLAGTAEAQPAQ
ncbi:MAG: efflux transporter outer membrane subunit [Steroidobacteraceae bacterium]